MAPFLTDVWRLNYQNAAMALGTCNEEHKASCHVKKRYKFLFYIALPQLIGGISFHRLNSIQELFRKEGQQIVSSLSPTVEEVAIPTNELEQDQGSSSRSIIRPNNSNGATNREEEVVLNSILRSSTIISKRWQLLNIVILAVIHLVGTFALPNLKQWTIRFGVPTMFMLVVTVLFVSDNHKDFNAPIGSFLTTMRSVIVASFSKSTNDHHLNQEYHHSQTSPPYGRYLRQHEDLRDNLHKNHKSGGCQVEFGKAVDFIELEEVNRRADGLDPPTVVTCTAQSAEVSSAPSSNKTQGVIVRTLS
ncbi:hypothetical protein CsatA_022623 [Cannabis sativa]